MPLACANCLMLDEEGLPPLNSFFETLSSKSKMSIFEAVSDVFYLHDELLDYAEGDTDSAPYLCLVCTEILSKCHQMRATFLGRSKNTSLIDNLMKDKVVSKKLKADDMIPPPDMLLIPELEPEPVNVNSKTKRNSNVKQAPPAKKTKLDYKTVGAPAPVPAPTGPTQAPTQAQAPVVAVTPARIPAKLPDLVKMPVLTPIITKVMSVRPKEPEMKELEVKIEPITLASISKRIATQPKPKPQPEKPKPTTTTAVHKPESGSEIYEIDLSNESTDCTTVVYDVDGDEDADDDMSWDFSIHTDNGGGDIELHEADLMLNSTEKKQLPKLFSCSRCSKSFEFQAYLDVHIQLDHQLHDFDKLGFYKCNQCDFGTKWRDHLRVHAFKHTGEKPFHCSIEWCAFNTTRKGTLTEHMRMHTGYKPYKCKWPNCRYATVRPVTLRQHEHRSHGIPLPPDEIMPQKKSSGTKSTNANGTVSSKGKANSKSSSTKRQDSVEEPQMPVLDLQAVRIVNVSSSTLRNALQKPLQLQKM